MAREKFDHRTIEKKWQQRWQEERVFSADHPDTGEGVFVLDMFPYPSGDGLHVGHPEGYTASDIVSRYVRMNGKTVLHPMGWDAFGLPAENAAIKKGIHPQIVTQQNIKNFKRQIQSIGFSYDWGREINTTDPKYYRWTQWIFLQLFKQGLAYEKEAPIWWCPKDKTGLANEEVIDGRCERCGHTVERKMLRQWILKITEYADRLLEGLDKVDWPEGIKALQRNWIGRSEGAEIDFFIDEHKVTVFTTRPDTLFGATYVVLSPEHPLVDVITTKEHTKAVAKYKKDVASKSDLERTALEKEKTGVFTGAYAINPVNNEKIPVWIADYVLLSYGTGAIMAVPAHDERDYEFAKKYDLPIREVVVPYRPDKRNPPQPGKKNVERRNVHAFVTNPKTGKVLALKWTKHPWTTFPMGGVDDGEDIIKAAEREVREETGYKNLKLIRVHGGNVKAEYFAAHKDENRVAYTQLVSFELKNEQRDEVAAEELDEHEIIWLDPKEITPELIVHAELDVWLDRLRNDEPAYSGEGVLINSGEFDGLPTDDARKKIVESLQTHAHHKTQYKLRDWIFSRQRYWGEPIPLVHCPKDGVVSVPEKDLPVLLPDVEKYQPTGTGESPLTAIEDWVNTTCPKCGGPAKRETNTMPQWAGSCWYYIRFTDPHNDQAIASEEAMKAWLPVDLYVGGAEHAVLHLLYSRFWHKVLFDIGAIPKEVGDEPFVKLKNQGLILGPDGEKMSKSRGNVINPDDIIEQYGADTLRMYEMFMGPFEDAKPWSSESIIGVRRFLERVWVAAEKVDRDQAGRSSYSHRVVAAITKGIDHFHFNTCVSDLMKWSNEWRTAESIGQEDFEVFLKLLSPFAPHLAEELWQRLGQETMLAKESWPTFDPTLVQEDTATIAVQVNGKLRATLELPAGSQQGDVESAAKAEPNVKKYLTGQPKKAIFVKDKLVNFVV